MDCYCSMNVSALLFIAFLYGKTTKTKQQLFYGPLSGTTRVSRYQKKHSPTHPPSCSSSNLYQLLPSTTIHSILLVQIMCLAIFLHNLSPCPLWSTSWSGALHLKLHTFLHLISVFFCSTCTYHRNLFCSSINIISSIPSKTSTTK